MALHFRRAQCKNKRETSRLTQANAMPTIGITYLSVDKANGFCLRGANTVASGAVRASLVMYEECRYGFYTD